MIREAEGWVPPILYRRLLRWSDALSFRSYEKRGILSKNVVLKGICRGKRAFVLATGPSINQQDLQTLGGEDCYSISNFFLHEHIGIINPRFHFFAPYHEPLVLENYIEWLQFADKALPPETEIFLGHSTFPMVDRYRLFPGRKVHYLYLSGHPSNCDVDITKPVLCPQSGPLMMLPVLLYMGYDTVYLLGCDHNNLKDYKKPMEHFYPSSKDVRKNASDENSWDDVTNTMKQAHNLFSQYDFYKKLYRQSGSRIVNLSNDSWLDMFETNNLAEIINRPTAYPDCRPKVTG